MQRGQLDPRGEDAESESALLLRRAGALSPLMPLQPPDDVDGKPFYMLAPPLTLDGGGFPPCFGEEEMIPSRFPPFDTPTLEPSYGQTQTQPHQPQPVDDDMLSTLLEDDLCRMPPAFVSPTAADRKTALPPKLHVGVRSTSGGGVMAAMSAPMAMASFKDDCSLLSPTTADRKVLATDNGMPMHNHPSPYLSAAFARRPPSPLRAGAADAARRLRSAHEPFSSPADMHRHRQMLLHHQQQQHQQQLYQQQQSMVGAPNDFSCGAKRFRDGYGVHPCSTPMHMAASSPMAMPMAVPMSKRPRLGSPSAISLYSTGFRAGPAPLLNRIPTPLPTTPAMLWRSHVGPPTLATPPHMAMMARQLSLRPPPRQIGIYSPLERRQRIQRFLEKRKQRVFHKRIKYACRKRLANACPRVKGRFVRHADYLEAVRNGQRVTHPRADGAAATADTAADDKEIDDEQQ